MIKGVSCEYFRPLLPRWYQAFGVVLNPSWEMQIRSPKRLSHCCLRPYSLYPSSSVQFSPWISRGRPTQFSAIFPCARRCRYWGWRSCLHEGDGAASEETHLRKGKKSKESTKPNHIKGPLGRCYCGVQRNGEENFQRLKCTTSGANKVSTELSLESTKISHQESWVPKKWERESNSTIRPCAGPCRLGTYQTAYWQLQSEFSCHEIEIRLAVLQGALVCHALRGSKTDSGIWNTFPVMHKCKTVQFCGSTVAVLSLLSPCMAR